MKEQLKKQANPEPVLDFAMVTGERDSGYAVLAGEETYAARKAAGCLVKPEPGDSVLISLDAFGRCFILTVLERGENGALRTDLDLTGDVNLTVHGGKLRLSADEDLTLGARNELSVTSGKLSVHAGEGEASFDRVSLLTRILTTQAKRIKRIADTCEEFFDTLTQRLTNCFRSIQDHDETQAGSARQVVSETWLVQTRNTAMMAEQDVKIDAEHIDLG
jgi:hypothetical protein